MFTFIAAQPTPDCVACKPVPALYRRAEAMDIPPFPAIGEAGTGGLKTGRYYQQKSGYQDFEVIRVSETASPPVESPFASLMEDVQTGFGRTMNRLPEVFGVSRQTIYNWLSGEKTPKEQHHAKLYQLAAAAKIFQTAGFKPSSATLDKAIAHGKSLLQIIAEGGNGEDAANRLLRILKRGSEARAKLADIIGDRKPQQLQASDMGALHLDERS